MAFSLCRRHLCGGYFSGTTAFISSISMWFAAMAMSSQRDDG